jgi:diacylglycerol kinase (ATP)
LSKAVIEINSTASISRGRHLKFISILSEKNFIVFINPISGTGNKGSLRSIVEKRMAKEGASFQILDTEQSGRYDFLPEKIQRESVTDIIICGGDGSVNQVGSALAGVHVNVGIIPMGSGNGLALAAGIPKNPVKALDVIFKGTAAFIDAFMINDQFSCMLCGLGFDAQVAHDFAAQSKRGLPTYIRQTLKNFFKATPYPFEIKANGSVIKSDAFFISIANSNQFGNNFTIAPKASLSDGLLDIVIVNKTGKLNLIYTVLKQVRAGKVVSAAENNNTVHYFQTKKMSIANPGNAPLHNDGEPVETTNHFEIEIKEKAFRLLQPAP